MDKHKSGVVMPNAKINIGLYVLNVRPDGLHNLETVFYPISWNDVLRVEPLIGSNEPWRLSLDGLPIAGEAKDNLLVKVFLAMQQEFGLPSQTISLQKRIPMGAGLGGGSSDAAHLMLLLNEKYQLGMSAGDMCQRLARFGADCPFFVTNKPAFAQGIGDELSPLDLQLRDKYYVIVKPPFGVSTRDAYADVPCRDKAPINLCEVLMKPVEVWRDLVSNDFELSVFPKYPEIAAIKQTLYDMHALYASMSGSGSAVFGIFDRPIDNIQDVFPKSQWHTGRMGVWNYVID